MAQSNNSLTSAQEPETETDAAAEPEPEPEIEYPPHPEEVLLQGKLEYEYEKEPNKSEFELAHPPADIADGRTGACCRPSQRTRSRRNGRAALGC